MAGITPSNVTTVLQALRAGDPDAQDRLLELVYDDLRRLAAGFMRHERPDHTLQPTAVVNEFLLRLFGRELQARNRGTFFALATRAMRRILAEHARSRATQKRGSGRRRVPLDDVADYFERQNLDVVAVNEALEKLASIHERQSQVVSLHYIYGFTVEEVARQLEVSPSTVESDLRYARAWLHQHLAGTDS